VILRMLNRFKVMQNEYISIMPIYQYEMATKQKKSLIRTDLIWNLKFENKNNIIISFKSVFFWKLPALYLINIESYRIISYQFLVLIFQSHPCLKHSSWLGDELNFFIFHFSRSKDGCNGAETMLNSKAALLLSLMVFYLTKLILQL
jgi:hypothetical protein